MIRPPPRSTLFPYTPLFRAVLELYETVAEPLTPRALSAARAADYITFTSSSTVRYLLEAAGGEARLSPGTRSVSIGPITSETLREHGLEPDVEAERHDVDGVIEALVADARTPASWTRARGAGGGRADGPRGVRAIPACSPR